MQGPGFYPQERRKEERKEGREGGRDRKGSKSESIALGGYRDVKFFILMIKTLIKTKKSITVDIHGNKPVAMNSKIH
jgi:hypothetical protein